MTVESERNVYAVYKNGRIEFQFAKIKVENESKVRRMHKKAGREVGCTTMTKKSESKVCGIDKTSRHIELRSAPMTRVRSRSVECIKRAKWSWDAQQGLLRVRERSMQSIRSTDKAKIRTNDTKE